MEPGTLNAEADRIRTERCTCGQLGLCVVHRRHYLTRWAFISMRVRVWCWNHYAAFRWRLARIALGGVYYRTVFECPECGNHHLAKDSKRTTNR